MIKDVRVGFRLSQNGLLENHRAYPSEDKLRIFGGDTETVEGEPYTLQLAGPKDEMMEKVTGDTIFQVMMRWLVPRSIDKGINLVWFHNLNFDLRVIFHKNLQSIYDQYNDIRLERDGFVIKMLYGRVNQADIWEDFGGYLCPDCPDPIPKDATDFDGKKRVCTRHVNKEPGVRRNLGKKVRLMDSAAFCPPGGKSLVSALHIYEVPYKKFKQPDGLGTRRLWTKEFKEYALNDARAERALGRKIMDLHREYDVTTCVSLPQLASRILRHHYFLPKESMPFPPEECRLASELSYHAGKNGFYVKRGVYENCYEFDINSAFPKAMRELPQMVKGRYERVNNFKNDRIGIYRISGSCRGVKIPAIFNHDFTAVKEKTSFKNLWVTGYEIECLKKDPAYDFEIKKGWVWEPDTRYNHSPLKEFVDRFWHLKNVTPKGPKRDTYKNILNSLYGKFAACVEHRPYVETHVGLVSVTDTRDPHNYFVAGSLYNPFVATQITGYVRKEIYEYEKEGEALHTATDSIKSLKNLPTSDELGGLKKEVFGRCWLFRNKLYLHFSRDNQTCGHDLRAGWIGERGRDGKFGLFEKTRGEPSQHLCKWGLHGFKGSVRELFERRHELMDKGFIDYEFNHMVNLREGIRRGETPSQMLTRQERLQL